MLLRSCGPSVASGEQAVAAPQVRPLILHAAHEYPWGKDWAPDIGTFTSLGVIVAVLAITVIASLRKTRNDPSAIKKVHPPLGAAKEQIPGRRAGHS